MASKKLGELQQEMLHAGTYTHWKEVAAEVDLYSGARAWREQDESHDYDYRLVRARVAELRRLRAENQGRAMVHELRQGLHWNLGNMGNAALYSVSLVGTKHLIEGYLKEVTDAMRWLCDTSFDDVSVADKRELFESIGQAYGRSALMLSGGATLGLVHVGVVRALYLHGLLPQVLSGSSAGSIVGSAISSRTPEQAEELLDPDNIHSENWGLLPFAEAWRRGGLMDQNKLRRGIAENIPDVTFEEAYRNSGLAMNITVSPVRENQPARLLNHLTFPHLYLREAVLASCAVPMLFPPVQMANRSLDGHREAYMPSLRWADGSLKSDLPRMRLRRLFNVNHFIVSQTNPHVLPFMHSGDPHGRGLGNALRHMIADTAKVGARNVLHLVRANIPRPLENVRRGFDDIHGILEQDYRGNITILPRLDLRNYARVVRNPQKSDIVRMIRQGEVATWPRMAMVHDQTIINRTIANCLAQLTATTIASDQRKAG
ncbi:MAG: patatin-like phospholipase family protein [Oceanococcaceae bacterium]